MASELGYCTSCGAERVPGSYCVRCGARLGAPRQPALDGSRLSESLARRFNLGAAILAPLWLMFHGRPVLGLVLFILNPGLNRMADQPGSSIAIGIQLAISAYFGVRGNEIAWRSQSYASVESFRSQQRRWAIAAGLLVGGFLILFLLFSVFLSPP